MSFTERIQNIYTQYLRFTGLQFSDYLVPGFSLAKGASAPTLKTFRGTLDQNAFAGSGPTEQAFFTVHILHDIKAGSNPTFHIHWAHIIAVPSGDVKWQVDYTTAKGYEAGTFAAETSLSTIQTAGAQFAHHITDDDDMVITDSLEPDSVIVARVYRDSSDGSDTFGDDAYLLQVDLHYQIGQHATIERNRPFTSGGF